MADYENFLTQDRIISILESISDGFFVLDNDFKLIYFNSSAEKLLNRKKNDVLGKKIFDAFPEAKDSIFEEKYSLALKDKIYVEFETYFGIPPYDNWYKVKVYPFENGITIHFHITTEQKKTTEALKISEKKFRTLFETMTQGVVYHDKNGKITIFNPSSEKILGLSNDEITGKTSEDPVWQSIKEDGSNYPGDNHPVMIALKTGKPVLNAVMGIYNYKEKKRKWININSIPLFKNDDTAPYEIYSTFEDITYVKEAKEERENIIEELRKKNNELERFAYTISHDLKSPLVTIRGFLELIKEDFKKNNYDEFKKNYEFIAETTNKMEKLLNDLLKLAKTGQVKNLLQPVSSDEILKEVLNILKTKINEKKVEIIIENEMPEIYCDKIRISEVFQNLIENSIKFTMINPEIRIGCSIDEIKKNFIFYVKDNGIGLDKKYFDSVFDIFEKIDISSEGTGIGLSLVKTIIEGHNGKIWIESQGNGKGTTVFFTIPKNTKE